jgi:hypothetical protein
MNAGGCLVFSNCGCRGFVQQRPLRPARARLRFSLVMVEHAQVVLQRARLCKVRNSAQGAAIEPARREAILARGR